MEFSIFGDYVHIVITYHANTILSLFNLWIIVPLFLTSKLYYNVFISILLLLGRTVQDIKEL